MMMMGAVSSNFFRVKDVQEFENWIRFDVKWGENERVTEGEGRVRYWGWGDNTYLQPMRFSDPEDDEEHDEEDDDEENVDYEDEPWDIAEFVARLREHLAEPQEVRFVSAFLDIYGIPHASILVIPVSGPPLFVLFDVFDDGMLRGLQEQAKLAA